MFLSSCSAAKIKECKSHFPLRTKQNPSSVGKTALSQTKLLCLSPCSGGIIPAISLTLLYSWFESIHTCKDDPKLKQVLSTAERNMQEWSFAFLSSAWSTDAQLLPGVKQSLLEHRGGMGPRDVAMAISRTRWQEPRLLGKRGPRGQPGVWNTLIVFTLLVFEVSTNGPTERCCGAQGTASRCFGLPLKHIQIARRSGVRLPWKQSSVLSCHCSAVGNSWGAEIGVWVCVGAQSPFLFPNAGDAQLSFHPPTSPYRAALLWACLCVGFFSCELSWQNICLVLPCHLQHVVFKEKNGTKCAVDIWAIVGSGQLGVTCSHCRLHWKAPWAIRHCGSL